MCCFVIPRQTNSDNLYKCNQFGYSLKVLHLYPELIASRACLFILQHFENFILVKSLTRTWHCLPCCGFLDQMLKSQERGRVKSNDNLVPWTTLSIYVQGAISISAAKLSWYQSWTLIGFHVRIVKNVIKILSKNNNFW